MGVGRSREGTGSMHAELRGSLHSEAGFTQQRKGRTLIRSEDPQRGQQRSKLFSLNLYNNLWRQGWEDICQIRKLMPRDVKDPRQGHTVTKWQSQAFLNCLARSKGFARF